MRSTFVISFLVVIGSFDLAAQAPDDAMMLSRKSARVGMLYAHDSWDEYWEGTLKRSNGNIGTLTTQSVTWMGAYGVTDRFNVMMALPYIWTHSSQGTSHGLRGVQDLAIAAKYKFLRAPLAAHGVLNAFVGAAAGVPASDYTPDYLPLSIGSASKRASARLTLNFQSTSSWFINTSAAHTWRANVKLDRIAYYTNGQLYMTNEVDMPNLFDYTVAAGYQRGRWCIPLSFTQQRTLGGSDIRRQDMPFVSNRMDFGKVDATVMYTPNVALLTPVSLRLGVSQVVSGRNVGQSTTLTSGLLYALHF